MPPARGAFLPCCRVSGGLQRSRQKRSVQAAWAEDASRPLGRPLARSHSQSGCSCDRATSSPRRTMPRPQRSRSNSATEARTHTTRCLERSIRACSWPHLLAATTTNGYECGTAIRNSADLLRSEWQWRRRATPRDVVPRRISRDAPDRVQCEWVPDGPSGFSPRSGREPDRSPLTPRRRF